MLDAGSVPANDQVVSEAKTGYLIGILSSSYTTSRTLTPLPYRMKEHITIPSQCKALQLQKPARNADGSNPKRNLAVLNDVQTAPETSGMVLVKMHAAGFNRRDEWSMMGMYPGLTFVNSTFGCDGAGVVVRGSKSQSQVDLLPPHPKDLVILVPTRGWSKQPEGPEAALPGAAHDIVTNRLGGQGFGLLGCTKQTNGVGTMTEYCQVEEDQIVNAPAHLNAVQASALPCGGVTAYRALFTKAGIQKDQNLLITGIGGGVALLALQLAVAAGVNVFVTGGTSAKVERAIQMGAKGGVVYRDDNWPKELASLVARTCKDRPYLDAVIDSAGGNIPAQSASAGLRQGGKIVCFGMTANPEMSFTMREVLRNVDVVGSTMGSADEFRRMIKFVNDHRIVPVIDTVLEGLEKAKDGFPLLQDADKRSGGKVIVRISTDDSQPAKL